jgi:hypothetical protein
MICIMLIVLGKDQFFSKILQRLNIKIVLLLQQIDKYLRISANRVDITKQFSPILFHESYINISAVKI